MLVLLIIFFVFVPLLAGRPVRKILDYTGQGILDTYLSGVLTLFIISGALQVLLLKLKRPFSDYEKIYPLLLALLCAIGLALFVIDVRGEKKEQSRKERFMGVCRTLFQSRESQIFGFLTFAVVLLCILRIFTETPDIRGDFTLETMRTTLSTNTIYQYDSFTGMVIEEGMPIRQQVLTLPFFLAFLSHVFRVEETLLLYRIFPCFVLVLALLVYGRWGGILFPSQRQKQIGFLLVVSVMLLAGDYTDMAPGTLLLHQGFTGNGVCAGFVIPYAIYLCMRKKWLLACICAGAELFLIWTTYGLGYSVLVLVLSALPEILDNLKVLLNRKRKV